MDLMEIKFAVCECAAEVSGLNEVYETTNLRELGLDSLDVTLLQFDLEERLNVEVDLRRLTEGRENVTIADLAAYIMTLNPSESTCPST